MDDRLEAAARLFGVEPATGSGDDPARREIEGAFGRRLPKSVADLLRFPGLLEAASGVYSSDAVFPRSVRYMAGEQMPGRQGDVLWLMTENQGVCVWGVPLDAGEDPPVLVGGSLESGEVLVEYAPSVADFLSALAWDKRLFAGDPMIQAQAAPVDDRTLGHLRAQYREGLSTFGWPARTNHRFEGAGGLKLALWAGARQCDWWIVADQMTTLEAAVSMWRHHSDLEMTLWSNDGAGSELLDRLGVRGPWKTPRIQQTT